MKGLKKMLLWFYLLQKRLFRKKIFPVILLAIPLAVLLLAGAVKENTGMVKILLCAEERSGVLAEKIIERLAAEESIILFQKENEVETACDMLQYGKADAVWIFQKDFSEKLIRFSHDGKEQELVAIKRADDSVFLKLAEERLFGVLFPELSYQIYHSFIQEKIPDGSFTEEDLQRFYDATRVEESLFQFAYVNHTDASADVEKSSYLTVPVRGLLALFVMLCGLAAALFYMKDEKKGIFTCMPITHRYLFSLGYHAVAVFDGAAAMLLALLCLGSITEVMKEIVLLAVYTLLVAVFCNVLRMVCRRTEYLGMLIPILLLFMLAVCPIFFNIKKFPVLRNLLPPVYYLSALHDNTVLIYMFVYLAVLTVVGYLFTRVKEIKG